ncbi:MAG: hypothetical protein HY020_15315 [Burkholderiales bacterium]|nr:hypothetical protein [Burkholderiales bacterium]
MSPETYFQSKAPQRLPAALWSIIAFLAGAIAMLSGTLMGAAFGLLCALLVVVLVIAIAAPSQFLYGVRCLPFGFEFRAPLRRVKVIDLGDIARIDAISLRDGDSGLPFVDLAINTRHGRVLLTEGVLSESGLLTKLKGLPGFDANAYDTAVQHEPRDFLEPLGKRFRVLDVS